MTTTTHDQARDGVPVGCLPPPNFFTVLRFISAVLCQIGLGLSVRASKYKRQADRPPLLHIGFGTRSDLTLTRKAAPSLSLHPPPSLPTGPPGDSRMRGIGSRRTGSEVVPAKDPSGICTTAPPSPLIFFLCSPPFAVDRQPPPLFPALLRHPSSQIPLSQTLETRNPFLRRRLRWSRSILGLPSIRGKGD